MNADIFPISEIKDRLKPVFDDAPVYRAILFGSYARGEATARSDVDIVVDSRGQLLNIYFYGLLEDISEKLEKNIDMFEISEIQNGSPIYEEIFNRGILIYER